MLRKQKTGKQRKYFTIPCQRHNNPKSKWFVPRQQDATYDAGALPHVGIIQIVDYINENGISFISFQERAWIHAIDEGCTTSEAVWGDAMCGDVPCLSNDSAIGRSYTK